MARIGLTIQAAQWRVNFHDSLTRSSLPKCAMGDVVGIYPLWCHPWCGSDDPRRKMRQGSLLLHKNQYGTITCDIDALSELQPELLVSGAHIPARTFVGPTSKTEHNRISVLVGEHIRIAGAGASDLTDEAKLAGVLGPAELMVGVGKREMKVGGWSVVRCMVSHLSHSFSIHPYTGLFHKARIMTETLSSQSYTSLFRRVTANE
ncbi:hypothetical protein Sjap_022299 [Stephania japonica]|uniref:Uncharacterized protein n=1 Tax=Stephania japonica TaxID=461633 RepID=A0AAP0ERS8_9MAGN